MVVKIGVGVLAADDVDEAVSVVELTVEVDEVLVVVDDLNGLKCQRILKASKTAV